MTNKSHMNLSTKVRKIKQNQAVIFNNYLTAESELVRQALRGGAGFAPTKHSLTGNDPITHPF